MSLHKMAGTYAIIPAYNEGKNISGVIIKAKKYVDHVVVVDDGSKDNTLEKAKMCNVAVLHHFVNLGKGAALRTGCDYAFKNNASSIIVLDGDGQHKPEDIPRFLSSLKKKDIVFGSRRLNKKMPLIYRTGNLWLKMETQALFGIHLADTQSGFRAFKASVYQKIRWKSNDYSMESEMIANVGKHKLKYSEIFIDTIYKDTYKGTTVFDGMKIMLDMLWFKLLK